VCFKTLCTWNQQLICNSTYTTLSDEEWKKWVHGHTVTCCMEPIWRSKFVHQIVLFVR
jgi:hypothetical protein